MLCLVLIGIASPVAAAPLTCEELVDHASIERWEHALRTSTASVVDLTGEQWLGDAATVSVLAPGGPRIVAVNLPPHAPLVEVTCALGRRLMLAKDDILVVVSRYGLHAYAPTLGYGQLRALARRHNPDIDHTPMRAAVAFSREVESAAQAKRAERNTLGALGLACLTLATVALLVLLKRR